MATRIKSPEELMKLPKPPSMKMPSMPRIGREYHYIVTKIRGRQVLLGPYDDEKEANEFALGKVNTGYKVITLPTRDRNKAGQILRHTILSAPGGNLEDSLKRMKRKI